MHKFAVVAKDHHQKVPYDFPKIPSTINCLILESIKKEDDFVRIWLNVPDAQAHLKGDLVILEV